MSNEEKKTVTLNMEVIKFAISIGVPLLALVGAYFNLRSDVDINTSASVKHDTEIVNIQNSNHIRDLETVEFRANMTNRVRNIEELTQEIHGAIVGDGVR